MARDAEERASSDSRIGDIGVGWRVLQVVALVAGVSYLIGWALAGPARYFEGVLDEPGALASYTSLVGFLSPLVAIAAILLALDPHRLNILTRTGPAARIVSVALLVLTLGWLINAFFTPMYGKFVSTPLDPAQVLPIPGGVALHMVVQHWFLSLAVLALALIPHRFGRLIESPRPAGIQCALVHC